MDDRVLIAVDDEQLASDAATIVDEATEGATTVVQRVRSTNEVLLTLDDLAVDIVLIDEALGPLPVLDLVRQLATRFPEVAVIVATRNQSAELLRSALRAGVRGVVGLPFTLEEMQAALQGAGQWSRSVRDRVAREVLAGSAADVPGGGMITLAGAKGGVGTTTLALHLALAAARSSPSITVCLVDLDLQGGDVRSLLDLRYRRGIEDLIDVIDDMSGRQLEDSLYPHPSRLRILLPPAHGEVAEEITTRVARQVLGAIRTRFDLVVVDSGTTVTDASAVAVEMADRAVIVATPDVPALRSANRLIDLWARLNIRKEDIAVALNRVSNQAEVQPDLASKVLDAPLIGAAIPAAFNELEAATNTGVPDRLEPGLVQRALGRLGRELELLPKVTRARRRFARDDGSAVVEHVGISQVVAVVLVLLSQIVLVGLTFVYAGHAASEAAHAVSIGAPASSVAGQLPGAWRDEAQVDVGTGYVEVRLPVPTLLPGMHLPWTIPARVGTVAEAAHPGSSGGAGSVADSREAGAS